MPRGRGHSTPADPAPQHNLPGRLATRSDGGPTDQLPYQAEQHGDRQEFGAHQAAGGPGGPGGPGPGGGIPGDPAAMMGGLPDIFGPSDHPDQMEPSPAGMSSDPAELDVPPDPDLALRILYARYPHPDLLRLLQRRQAL